MVMFLRPVQTDSGSLPENWFLDLLNHVNADDFNLSQVKNPLVDKDMDLLYCLKLSVHIKPGL